MKTRAILLSLIALLVSGLSFVPAQNARANHGCTTVGALLACELHLQGTYSYFINGNSHRALRLTNHTGQAVQLNQVAATPVVTNLWGEYCVYRDHFDTEQVAPGIGEVGCINKEAYESGFLPLRWDGISTALAVPNGSTIYIQGYVKNGQSQDWRNTFTISSRPQIAGIISYRQPKVDQVIACNGGPQLTAWSPWKNTTGHNLVIGGATIYAGGLNHSVDVAAIYILNTNREVRWSYTTGVNTRNVIDFPNQVVRPNEFIAGQARNTCQVGQLWGWAGYIYTWNQ